MTSYIMEHATYCHAGVLYATAVAAVTILLMTQGTAGQTCGASTPCVDSSQCCSTYNYCGTTTDYCGTGCQNGPCTGSGGGGSGGSGGSGWSSFFTQSIFENYFPARNQAFYTYQELQTAAQKYPAFGTTGDLVSQKREVAAFCANVKHESGGLTYIEETNPQSSPDYPYCESTDAAAPCAPGKAYYGRGPLQLSWNYNYNDAGNALGIALLQNPDLVAQDGNVAFQTSLWFWMTQGPHDQILAGSFSGTIKKINSMECGFQPPGAQVKDRVQNYQDICSTLGVDPGSDLYC